jgi:hypothetical protein
MTEYLDDAESDKTGFYGWDKYNDGPLIAALRNAAPWLIACAEEVEAWRLPPGYFEKGTNRKRRVMDARAATDAALRKLERMT